MARIVFFCHDTRPAIATFEYYTQDIEALEALGHEVIVCTRYREIPWRFDAMFVWWWTHALWPALLCRLRGRPCLIAGTFNFRFPPAFRGTDYFRRPLWQRALIAGAVRLASRNLFVNEHELHGCEAFFGVTSARFFPHCVSDDYFAGPADRREPALFNLAWSGRGNLERKGIPELLEAIRLLKADGVAVHLYQGGPVGDGAPWLQETIRRLGIEDRVTYLGTLSRADKLARMRGCEVFVQPSQYEGFGLAIAEAMATGACVITCDVGAVRWVVGEAGLYVPPGSAGALAEAIKRVLSDPALRARLQHDASVRARERFRAAQKRDRLRTYLAELGIA